MLCSTPAKSDELQKEEMWEDQSIETQKEVQKLNTTTTTWVEIINTEQAGRQTGRQEKTNPSVRGGGGRKEQYYYQQQQCSFWNTTHYTRLCVCVCTHHHGEKHTTTMVCPMCVGKCVCISVLPSSFRSSLPACLSEKKNYSLSIYLSLYYISLFINFYYIISIYELTYHPNSTS